MSTAVTIAAADASPERKGGTGFGGGRQVLLPPATPHAQSHRIPEACHGPAGLSMHHEELSVKAALVPKELYEHIVEAGVTKSKWRLDKQIVMGLLAGFYIGFSFTLTMIIGGQIPEVQHGDNPGFFNLVLGAFGFPLGLFMIAVVGADLFTSNCSYMVTALHEGRISIYALLKSWILSWLVNLAGCIIMAEIVHAADIFGGRSDFVLYMANKKTHYTFTVCMCKAILANWLVNIAIWIANCAQDVTGKAVGIFLPISAFISIGGEHCVANMFLFSLAKCLGWDASVGTIVGKSLVPATLGNIIGGTFFVGTLYSLSMGTLFDSTYEHMGRAYGWVTNKTPDEVFPHGPGDTWWHRCMQWIVSPHWMHRDEENPDGTATAAGKAAARRGQHDHRHFGLGSSGKRLWGMRAHTPSGTPVIVVHDDHESSLACGAGENGHDGKNAAAPFGGLMMGHMGNGHHHHVQHHASHHVSHHHHITSTAHHMVPPGAAAGQKLASAMAETSRLASDASMLNRDPSGPESGGDSKLK